MTAPTREWYRDAIVYELHLRAFADSNGDGIGDLDGLTSKLDYLHELGVTALWVLPFYPSPHRDGGYDIADYRSVNPAYGDLRAFRRLLRAAHERRMKVITELVLNHTSDQHPWFQRARRSPSGSRWRDFYVWNDTPDRYRDARIIFQDFETSNWTWDPVAGAYFWHRFYSHQPDLNFDNPEVQDEILAVLDHWMELGVDGVRLDAVPYLFEREGTDCENLAETHEFLRRVRKHLDAHYDDRLILAEANQWPEDAAAYFGVGDECHMNFHFPLMPRLFMSLRQENRTPIIDILEQTPALPPGCEWATFLRNHDELTLEMVTDEERDYMYRAYAADPQMRLNLGIRRRLAPLLGNDRRKIELLNALLFSLPGTPVIYYGDEIGMGDNVYLGDRDGVRTPMQWSADRNAGFSTAGPHRLYLPPIVEGPYHYETVNVENQRHDPTSLLSWMRQLIAVRQRHAVLAAGDIAFLEPDNHHVLAYLRHLGDEPPILVVANLSQRAQSVELDLRRFFGATPVEVFGGTSFAPIGEWPYYLTLAPYGFYWFQLTPKPASSDDTRAAFEPPHLDTTWPAALEGRSPALAPALRRWIQHRRWYAGKTRRLHRLRIEPARAPGSPLESPLRVCTVTVDDIEGGSDAYLVPLTVVSGERARVLQTFRPQAVVAVLEEGLVVDALLDEGSVVDLIRPMTMRRAARPFTTESSVGLRNALAAGQHDVRLLSVEQSNTSVVIDDRVMVKVLRRLQSGENIELEVARHLRDVGYRHGAPLLGSLSWRRPDGPDTVALAYAYCPNEGDAWTHVLDQLDLYFQSSASGDLTGDVPSVLGSAAEETRLLGHRTAELHLALASGDDPMFRPEAATALYQRSLYSSLRGQLRTTLAQLRRHLRALPPEVVGLADRVLDGREGLLARIEALRTTPIDGMRIQTHGDYHLGQVLFTGKDFVIIDFEGEPGRPLSERRIKRPPLRDVAGMVRSYDYAVHAALGAREERGLVGLIGEEATRADAVRWRDEATATFLAGYTGTDGIDELLPTEPSARTALLDAFTLEKALYELRYELDNRPSWVPIPLAALSALIRV